MNVTKHLKYQILWQAGFLAVLVFAGYAAVENVQANLENAGIVLSFRFLSVDAGFDISESVIAFSSTDSYGRVLVAGVLNTVLVAVVCIAGATFIGTFAGMLRTSGHWLGVRVAHLYIEIMRNLPKLLILLALYVGVINALPVVRESWVLLDSIYVSNRAVYFPTLTWEWGGAFFASAAFCWLVTVLVASRIARMIWEKTGRQFPVFLPSVAFFLGVLVVPLFLSGVDYSFSYPEFRGFDYVGGGRVSIQFLVLTGALSVYHGGQVAELVRGSIESVQPGQSEAADALGLSYFQKMRFVVLPQAVRAIVPPMGNQYLNITKNTSIALAVGYSDLVSVMTTSINQTFRPIELMTLTMLVYLGICLAVSAAINRYNTRLNVRNAQ